MKIDNRPYSKNYNKMNGVIPDSDIGYFKKLAEELNKLVKNESL